MPTASQPFFVTETDAPAKRSILVAALHQFASRGIDGVSIRDIADEAGFTNPALFRHFASKEDLARALFEACYRRLALELRMQGNADTRTLRDRIDQCLVLIEQSPQSVHYVLENLRRYWPQLSDEARAAPLPDLMRMVIEAEQRTGRVRADIDARLAAAVVLGTLAQMARLALFAETPVSAAALADQLWSLLNNGIGA